MRTIRYLLLASAMSLLMFEASFAQALLPKIVPASLVPSPNCPISQGSRSREGVCCRNRRPRPRNPDLYNVLVEIDVSILGESETYVFNCIRNGQVTVIQPMGRSPGSLAQRLSAKIRPHHQCRRQDDQ